MLMNSAMFGYCNNIVELFYHSRLMNLLDFYNFNSIIFQKRHLNDKRKYSSTRSETVMSHNYLLLRDRCPGSSGIPFSAHTKCLHSLTRHKIAPYLILPLNSMTITSQRLLKMCAHFC